jgi:beta-lactamase regulating signal transducer with metallopeptidase domain
VILSEGIVSSLSAEELRAVLFHELGHVQSRDPLRLGVAQFLADVLWFLPVARSLARDFVDAIEEGADDQAVMVTRQPLDLASALVKTAKAGLVSVIPLASSLAGNLSVEDRVKRLLGMGVKRRAGTTRGRWLTSGLIALFLLVVVMLPVAGREASVERAMEEAMMRMPMMSCSVPLRYGR